MQINDSTVIDVYNYTDSCVAIATSLRPQGHLFEPSNEGNPYVLQLSYVEIRGINSQSNIFREGYLRFDPKAEKEIYEALGIRNWETILKDEDIKKVILEPTKEGLEQLIKIDSTSLFERVRGMVTQLDNSKVYDIPIRVKEVIDKRYKELFRGRRVSEIIVRKTAAELDAENSEAKQKEMEDIVRSKHEAQIEAKIRAEYESKLKETEGKIKREKSEPKSKSVVRTVPSE